MKQESNELYVFYKETETGGEIECYEDENNPYSMRTPIYKDWNIIKVTNRHDNKFYPLFDTVYVDFNTKSGTTVYIVYVKYTTGNTFGRVYGCGHIVGAYETIGEAQFIVDSINNNTFEGSKPWVGYFEDLESVEYEEFTIY